MIARHLSLIFGLLLALGSPLAAAESNQTEALSAARAATLYGTHKAVIVDVREPDEWRQQHIPDAIHIPLGQLSQRLPELERYKNSPIIMQCRSGRRSLQASKVLQAAGFTQVYNLDGGLVAWTKAGFPTQQ